MKNKNRPFYLGIKISFFSMIVGFISTIISFILLLSNKTTETVDGKVVNHYSSVFLSWNMISFFLFIACLLLYIFIKIARFIKESKSEAWKVEKEEFKDDKEEGALLFNVNQEEIDYWSMLSLHFYSSKFQNIVCGIVFLLGTIGITIISLQSFDHLYFYLFLAIIIGSILFFLVNLFIVPIFKRKNIKCESCSVYQDKITKGEGENIQIWYYSQFSNAFETKNFIFFIYPDDGIKAHSIPKKELSADLLSFLVQKIEQVKKNNKH